MTKKKDPENLQKRGRKSGYEGEETIRQATKLCKMGAKDSDLAEFFQVTETTINNWKEDYPEFFESIKKAKDEYDTNGVENALLNRARGMSRIVERYDSISGQVIQLTEEVLPDPTSMIFWLKNRNKDRWRDKQDVEHSGSINLRPVINYGKKPTQ